MIKKIIVMTFSIIALVIAARSVDCTHTWDAMTTAFGQCSGTSSGACSYEEGQYPIGCAIQYNYNCEAAPGCRWMLHRTWTGTCSWFSYTCSGSSAGPW